MSMSTGLPTYEQLFGDLDFKKGDEGRSVYSPAAYLTDLLQLLDDYFENADLDSRRADIKDILLNAENSFNQTPYLDIVNQILEHRAGPDVYGNLRTARYPFNMPFDLAHERAKLYLSFMGASQQDLYRLFSTRNDEPSRAQIALDVLGLSAQAYFEVVAPNSQSVGTYYGFADASELNFPFPVERFLQITGLSGVQLRELLFQQLSETAKNPEGKTERSEAARFFVNNNLDGYAGLDAQETAIIWVNGNDEESSPAIQWFGRVSQFVRLAQRTGLSFSDLDCVLRNCCDNTLGHEQMGTLAVALHLQKTYELPMDVVCSLLSGRMNALGQGSEKDPQDLFNRTYNGRFAHIQKTYFSSENSAYRPEAYKDYAPIEVGGDLLAPEQKNLRLRLQQALQVGKKDLFVIVGAFREHAKAAGRSSVFSNNLNTDALSLLFRVSQLMGTLDISAQELMDVLGVLGKDPSLRKSRQFPLLMEELATEGTPRQNGFDILENGSVADTQWLVQMLFAVVKWMQEYDFSGEELRQIMLGAFRNEKEAAAAQEQQIAFLGNLYRQFVPAMFGDQHLQTSDDDARSARVLHTALANSVKIAPRDKRILQINPDLAYHEAYDALSQIVQISPKDFTGLGLSEELLGKLYNNLILKNYLNPDGALNEARFPARAEDFVPATDFSAQRRRLFDVLHKLYLQELEEMLEEDVDLEMPDEDDEAEELAPSVADVSFSVFLSDLDDLNLSAEAKAELYDNLIFNGYIEETGELRQPEFFADTDNADAFEVNINLGAQGVAIFEKIKSRTERFALEPLRLNDEVFEDLNLSERELAQLVQNLRFNGYLDKENVFADKAALLRLQAANFNLALDFYPKRHKILNALQAAIGQFKAKFFSFKPEDFADAADRIVAQAARDALAADYFPDGKLNPAAYEFFANEENRESFNPLSNLPGNSRDAIFGAMQTLTASALEFQLSAGAMTEIGLEPEEQTELIGDLQTLGWLNDCNQVPEAQLPYFLNINNALVFQLEGYTDYNKDIFFLLNAVAVNTDGRLQDILAQLTELAAQQKQVVLDALAEVLGLDAEVSEVIAREMLGTESHIVADMVLPVLSVVDSLDRVTKVPDSNKFKLAYRRMQQFARLAAKLGLNKEETEVAFFEQTLTEKFPEALVLPAGFETFDALLELRDEAVEINDATYSHLIYLFKDKQYWGYDAHTYNLVLPPAPLSRLSEHFAAFERVDAAFSDHQNRAWVISGGQYFCRDFGKKTWKRQEREWGRVKNNFDAPERIDASFVDNEGKTYLFCGDQYVRYSGGYDHVDEGYPKNIRDNWKNELANTVLPVAYHSSIDASFQSPEGLAYLFKGNTFVNSADFSKETPIRAFWGKIKNNFAGVGRLDAVCSYAGEAYLFSGDQVMAYSDGLENNGVKGNDGSPQSLESFLPGLPEIFENGVDTVFCQDEKGAVMHLFKDDEYLLYPRTTTGKAPAKIKTEKARDKWGKVSNHLAETGIVDAAFVGLDGKTYLFSGNQYSCYSGHNYTEADEGYPRAIAPDWGGLNWVGAAFVLDGKTYLFGTNQAGEGYYVRYSTRNYAVADENFPQPVGDNWWNLPNRLQARFATPDAVFIGDDGKTYLFKSNEFISFNHLERWWSDPLSLREHWDSIPFPSVSAAFVGKDGKTYIFTSGEVSGEMPMTYDTRSSAKLPECQFVRYSDRQYNKIDDRYPKLTKQHWGKIVNNIAKTSKVDAALVLESSVVPKEGAKAETRRHTYLFSGNQFFRYTNADFSKGNIPPVDEGYPRFIKTSLKNEPRFQNLHVSLESGLDAAFADRRNVYLFKDDQWHVVSESLHKVYPSSATAAAQCVFLDGGQVFLEKAGQWQKVDSLEAALPSLVPALPPSLREVPAEFRQNLDAALHGTDGNTYLFKGAQCYNVLLERAYPLNEEWGRCKNNIHLDNCVDAAFTGRDGKTYLFSGDQFVSYTPDKKTGATFPGLTDGNPKPIAAQWGGLSKIKLAFVKGEKTYLFEKPDASGNMRYQCYSGVDYSKPDYDSPQTTDAKWSNLDEPWAQIPDVYVGEGFDSVDAVLFEDDNMFLIKGRDFVQYNEKSAHWSYPKPLDRAWRDMPFNETDFENIVTAFTGPDSKTYFFSDEAFVAYQSGLLVPQNGKIINPIRSTWGLSDNNFVRDNRIDAAFVDGEGFTYLFSGDQYVRYARGNYRFIDEGYPRDIVGNLRKEKPFANLPESFDEEMERLLAKGQSLGGAIANGRNIYLFGKDGFQVVSNKAAASYRLDLLGKIRNNIEENNRVDAAFVSEEGKTYLFSGDQYVRYSDSAYVFADDGFPRKIAGNLAAELKLKDFSAAFESGIDTVFTGTNGRVYFFKNKNYYASAEGEKPIAGKWGKVKNNFAGPARLDAVFKSPDGRLYAFKGEQFTRYSNSENEFADEGFPLSIKDNWGNLPVHFESGIDGAFVFEGRTYFLKGGEYVRYSRRDYRAIDAIYPQQFINRFGAWADFLLGDLRAISRFKRLQDEHGSGDYSLTGLLHPGIPENRPYEALSAMFDWDLDEIKWLKRNQVFLPSGKLFEVAFDLEAVLKMHEIFALTAKMGHGPSAVHDEVWLRWFEFGQLAEAASALYRFLGEMNSEKDWAVLSKQLHDAENILKRDALLPYAIVRINNLNDLNDSNFPQLRDARDLYEMLLIDVEMGSCGNTSAILEATAAIQLYFHRYFVNLEEVDLEGEEDEKTRAQLKKWWHWMKNYRVWEANRKVFIYPENFIRPELRDTKTPAFKTLEEDLLQNEVTDEAVLRVYKKYLDEYTEVSRLSVAGGYVYDDPDKADDKQLILFGRTVAEPPRFYYRTAKFIGASTDSVQWQAWRPFNNMIDAKRVYPVYAFGRIFVFWGKLEERLKDQSKAVIVNDGSNYSSESEKEYEIKIYFSFYNLNKEWASPQLLDTKITLTDKISGFELFVENSNLLGTHEHENIIVNCTYQWQRVMSKETKDLLASIETTINIWKNSGDRNLLPAIFAWQNWANIIRAEYAAVREGNAAYSLTPELYTRDAVKPVFSNQGLDVFRSIFAPTETISAKREVQLCTYENSTDGPWFSFDHKGGSFLVKPSVPKITVHPQAVSGNSTFPNWANLDAAFELGEERFFFKDNVYVTSKELGKEQPIESRWGKQNTDPAAIPKDAALVDGNLTFFFNGEECLIFTGSRYDMNARSGPFTLQQLSLQPNQTAPHFGTMLAAGWKRFDAGVRTPSGKLLFFNGKRYMLDSVVANEEVKERWGKAKSNSFTDPARSKVVAAFSLNTDVYLFNHEEFVKYTGGKLDFIAPGYPKPANLASLLDDLGVAVPMAKRVEYTALRIDGAYAKDGKIFVHHHPNRGFEISPAAKTVKEDNTLSFEVAYVNAQGVAVKQASGQQTVDAAFTLGNDLYLFKDKKYHQQSPIPTAFPSITNATWATKANISDRWGLQANILENGVDAAFVRERKLYLTKGNQYVRYSDPNLDLVDDGYPKQLSTNNENLPKWDRLDTAFVGNDSKTYFFRETKFRTSDNLNADQDTKPVWESPQYNIAEKGIDAAYIRDGKLFLLSGKMFFRYTLSASGAVGEFPDVGYPKPLAVEMDSAFVQNNVAYLISKGQYYKLSGDAEPDVLPAPKKIRGNWGNIPGKFQDGFDAALNSPTEKKLYFFKGGQYLEYATGEGEAMPYEIDSVLFDIIRLTTSTGYLLNERLFTGGLPKLLGLDTQELDEVPSFSTEPNSSRPTVIQVNENKVNLSSLPESKHLDFRSANGPYYWEIFFHAPFLLAQYFNSNQKFEAAKTWYEYIYDPTQKSNFWKYLPFREAHSANSDTKPWVYTDAELDTYFDDPFDPHAIAALRTVAYRKAIVMSYIDNLLDWGDMLFRQYTMESINEARMLYVLAYDMLGDKPENLGVKVLPEPATSYRGVLDLINNAAQNRALLALENARDARAALPAKSAAGGTVHDTMLTNAVYFFSPENAQFIEYWDRVEDRLYKIRHCLNIMGEAQPLPLFQPPIDPMALVQAAAGGGGLEAALASLSISAPHYRFSFMLDKAQQLVQKLNELGSELLSTLEKKDGEALSVMQNRHEGIIHGMTRSIRAANIEEAKKNIDSLKESLANASLRENRYNQWLNDGFTSLESTQLGLIIAGASLQGASAIIKLASGIVMMIPQTYIGLFNFGVEIGGDQFGEGLEKVAEALETGGEALSMGGEAVGIKAQAERTDNEWTLQKDMAASDARQIQAQIAGAEFQLQIAKREAEILEKEIEQNAAIATFYKEKFTNEQLYLWMAGKLSGLFFQYYKLAYDMAKYAERAFQFERGVKESEVNYVQPTYWDSRQKGLLVGFNLGYDLDRMQKAFIETDARGFEITKPVSLLEIEPMAFLQLKQRGRCEFSLTEAMYDYDFQGHYCRQIKTVSVAFVGMEDQIVNATLTQLSHKTVLESDVKAVKFLLNPKDQPPLTIRHDWRPNQQIALSFADPEEREKNNGLFELRFDTDRYLPFEGTGAVSDWRLELNGKRGSYDLSKLTNVVITVKYTASQGGQAFGQAVKGLLKPYLTGVLFNMAETFSDEWSEFLESDSKDLELTFTREQFPNMSSNKITGIFARFELSAPGSVSMVINGDADMTLKDGKYIDTSGLSIGSKGTTLTFTVKGNKALLSNVSLVMGYKAQV